MKYLKINLEYAQSLDIGNLLAYLTEIYGKEIYLKPQQLVGLLADLMNENEKIKRFYRRAILDDQIPQKIYRIILYSDDYESYLFRLMNTFAENNGYRTELAENIVDDFLFGFKQNEVEPKTAYLNPSVSKTDSLSVEDNKIDFSLLLPLIIFISLLILALIKNL